MGACLSPAAIEAAARRPAAADGPAHLAACPRCRRRVERARADLRLLGELRDATRAPARAGEALPGYHVERELRRGGQGVVLLAEQEATRRRVALKLPLGGAAASAAERRRFEREIELASRLHHPGIVTVFDSGTSAGVPWYAMEYVEGRPLDEWTRQRRPSRRESAELLARIASAVAYAHRHGVIHRDLKPANVLIDAEDAPHVLDFGAALAAAPGGPGSPESPESSARARLRETAPGEFLGTLAYAAPEQLRGDGRDVDTRTDVHALGLMLYELLTGELPPERDGGLAALVESAGRAPLPPSRRAPGIAADLDAIVAKALEPDPARRYGSAEGLARDLERHLAGEVVEARAHDVWHLLARSLARHRGALAAGGTVLVVALVLGAAWLRERRRAERQRDQADVVRAVFQDILGAAAPQRMGGDVRLLEVYELAARDIDEELRDAPDAQAAVELTIGDTYRRLLRAPEAIPHLERALARYREVSGAETEVARCANLLSLALADRNDPRAIPVAEEALALRERRLPAGDPAVAESRRTLAIALLAQFRDPDVARAEHLLDQAEESFRGVYGEDHPEVARTRLWRARAGRDHRSAEVGALLAGALDTLERRAPDDPDTIACLNADAAWLEDQGRFDEARALLDRSVVLTRRLYGEELATDMIRRYARLEFARGDAHEAELLSRKAIATELERQAAQRPTEATRLEGLAHRVEQPGSRAAEVPFGEAFAELRRLEGDGSFELEQWMNGVVLTLGEQGERGPVDSILREALRIRCRALGADCPVRQRTIELFAEDRLAAHRGAEAVPLLQESLATFGRQKDDSSPAFHRAEELLSACSAPAEPPVTSPPAEKP